MEAPTWNRDPTLPPSSSSASSSASPRDGQGQGIGGWYGGQTILMTGVTGLLGKVVLHKILSVLPDLPDQQPSGGGSDHSGDADLACRVMVLVRPKMAAKKGEAVPGRVRFAREVLTSPPLQTLLTARPSLSRYIYVVEGDIGEEGLGLSEEDRDLITSKATVILHMAATTRFTEHLQLSIEMNALGGLRVLRLAKQCSRLRALVHVSTCYVNCTLSGPPGSDPREIDETIYPIRTLMRRHMDPYKTVSTIEGMTYEHAEKMTRKIISPYPNTYTFSKMLGEQMLQKEKGSVPLCIVRPAIIGPAVRDPFPGWVDSLIGPAGVCLAGGMGVLHVMRGKSRQVADLIPVDYVCNTILTAAWHTAHNPPGRRIPIFHSASSGKNPIDWWTVITVGIQWFRRNPIKNELKQYPFAFVVNNYWLFLIAHIILHTTPAAIGDVIRMMQGRHAKLVTGSNHLYTVITQLTPFTSRQWQFLADNVDTKLLASMSEEDKNIFEIEVRKIDWEIYIITLAKGLVQYLLKEELTNNIAVAIGEKKKFTAAL
jgi:fatty acyl-CoA reductase